MSKDAPSLPDDPAKLKAMLLEYQRTIAQHQSVVAQYEETVRAQQTKLEQQEHRIAQLLRRLFGPKQERVDTDQLTLFDQEDVEQIAAEPENRTGSKGAKKRRRGHGRQLLPKSWPRETIVYELSEEERRCPCCGELRQEIGRETSEQAEYVPAHCKVLVHERVKYACRKCEEHVAIFLASKGKIREVACWAHCRRSWWEAKTTDSRRAHEALSYIARLNQLETPLIEKTPQERAALRQEHARPILEEFHSWLRDEEAKGVLPKSAIGKAFTYTFNEWEALCRYTDDGDLASDNNLAELAMKIPALGRKNWLFVASETGGRRAAILFSLVASCKANHVEPFAYLRDLFARLPAVTTPDGLDPLLPDRWLLVNPQHRWDIADQRKEEWRAKN